MGHDSVDVHAVVLLYTFFLKHKENKTVFVPSHPPLCVFNCLYFNKGKPNCKRKMFRFYMQTMIAIKAFEHSMTNL